jgi:hypothetical protein
MVAVVPLVVRVGEVGEANNGNVIILIRPEPASATTILPVGSTATPNGLLSSPLLPESVVTTPPNVTILTRLFPESATIILPFGSIATPSGALKLAAVPVPSAEPLVVCPARVVTTPADADEIRRMRWLLKSPITMIPDGDTVTPYG